MLLLGGGGLYPLAAGMLLLGGGITDVRKRIPPLGALVARPNRPGTVIHVDLGIPSDRVRRSSGLTNIDLRTVHETQRHVFVYTLHIYMYVHKRSRPS